ncbi:MAG TPA: cyclic nucleotide-binding domain-containing protein [Burkholderiaceae bacterium]|nr:cyclic nucleotide-binding domain-containing protein [Burkholderiaceae bacterium]
MTTGLFAYLSDLIDLAVAVARGALATPEGTFALILGTVAAVLQGSSTLVKTMIPLRVLALASNVCFVAYGALLPSFLVLLLHTLLIPINLYRLIEMFRLTQRVKAVTGSQDTSGLWLRPYMKRRKLKAGTVLFHKGDLARELYMLTQGRIELVEIGTELPAGRVFGEIAFFAPDRRRTMTARCTENSEVLAINESTVNQLYYQNPAFGFQMISLVADRLGADIRRLETSLEAQRSARAAVTPTVPIRSA